MKQEGSRSLTLPNSFDISPANKSSQPSPVGRLHVPGPFLGSKALAACTELFEKEPVVKTKSRVTTQLVLRNPALLVCFASPFFASPLNAQGPTPTMPMHEKLEDGAQFRW